MVSLVLPLAAYKAGGEERMQGSVYTRTDVFACIGSKEHSMAEQQQPRRRHCQRQHYAAACVPAVHIQHAKRCGSTDHAALDAMTS
jgi:hypothetical protein